MCGLGINTRLQSGKYRIEKMLGQGGFGITYLATQTLLNRKVAIKEFFMKDFCSRDTETRYVVTTASGDGSQVDLYKKKFIKEAKNLAKLHHPNIINVMDVFQENNTFYYVMPYYLNGSLQDLVKIRGTLTEKDAMRYLKQIGLALKYMHEEQHICHYDVKPANILLDDYNNAVLIDFGISKNYDLEGHETTTTPIGMSDGYSPIEQYRQNMENFSPASDIYSLGATLYFLLHGKRPISAVQRAEGEELVISNGISPSVRDIIVFSMKIARKERPQNMDLFVYTNTLYDTSNNDIQDSDFSSQYKIFEIDSTYTYADNLSNENTLSDNNSKNRLTTYIIFVIIVVSIAVGTYIISQHKTEQHHIEKASYQDYFEK